MGTFSKLWVILLFLWSPFTLKRKSAITDTSTAWWWQLEICHSTHVSVQLRTTETQVPISRWESTVIAAQRVPDTYPCAEALVKAGLEYLAQAQG